MTDTTVYIDNSNRLVLEGLQDEDSGSYLDSATVQVTLYDENDDEVTGSGVSWPLAMAHLSGSDGVYRGVLPAGMTLTPGALYYAHITATYAGLTGNWRFVLRADYRRS